MKKFTIVLKDEAEIALKNRVNRIKEFLSDPEAKAKIHTEAVLAGMLADALNKEISADGSEAVYARVLTGLKVEEANRTFERVPEWSFHREGISVAKLGPMARPRGVPVYGNAWAAIGTSKQVDAWTRQMYETFPSEAYGSIALTFEEGDKYRVVFWAAESAE